MIERASRSRFFREAAQALHIARVVRQQDLDRDVATQALVAGAPDFAAPARAEQSIDGVGADALAGTKAPSVGRELPGQLVEAGARHKLARGIVRFEKRQDVRAQHVVRAARARDELGSRFGRDAGSRRRTPGRAVASARCHVMPPVSAR